MTALYTESRLTGNLEEDFGTNDTTLRVRFFDKTNTSISRIPQQQRLRFTINLGEKNQEEILVSSHVQDDDDSDITILSIEARNLAVNGIDQSDNVGLFHSQYSSIDCVMGHWVSNVLESILKGNTFIGGIKHYEDETYFYIIFGDAENPSGLRVIKSTGVFEYTEDGTNWYGLNEREGITDGDGIDITDGILKIDSEDIFEYISGKLALKTAKNESEAGAGRVVVLNDDDEIDTSFISPYISNEEFGVGWDSGENEAITVSKRKLYEILEQMSQEIDTKVKTFSSSVVSYAKNVEHTAPRDIFVSAKALCTGGSGASVYIEVDEVVFQEYTEVEIGETVSFGQLIPKGSKWKVVDVSDHFTVEIRAFHRQG